MFIYRVRTGFLHKAITLTRIRILEGASNRICTHIQIFSGEYLIIKNLRKSSKSTRYSILISRSKQ